MECWQRDQNDSSPPLLDAYTLRLADDEHEHELQMAMANMRHSVQTQLSSKWVGNQEMRVGIYTMLEKGATFFNLLICLTFFAFSASLWKEQHHPHHDDVQRIL